MYTLHTHLSLDILAVLHDYYLKFPNSPLSTCNIIQKVHNSQFFWQNVHKIVINYAVSLKEISEQHDTVLH